VGAVDFYNAIEARLTASSKNGEEIFTILLVEVEVRKLVLDR